jgi:hypothetical protein
MTKLDGPRWRLLLAAAWHVWEAPASEGDKSRQVLRRAGMGGRRRPRVVSGEFVPVAVLSPASLLVCARRLRPLIANHTQSPSSFAATATSVVPSHPPWRSVRDPCASGRGSQWIRAAAPLTRSPGRTTCTRIGAGAEASPRLTSG